MVQPNERLFTVPENVLQELLNFFTTQPTWHRDYFSARIKMSAKPLDPTPDPGNKPDPDPAPPKPEPPKK